MILGAGERVFARAGLNGATMAAIADEAGLPKANLHYYFGSKLDLYRAVLARVYPEKTIRAALVFSERPAIMEVSGAAMDAALAEALARVTPR